jgi:iron complex outermembrane receptor protein
MKKFAFVLLSISTCFFCEAQVRISGVVRDAASRLVPGASVTLLNTGRGAVSGTEGRYVLEVAAPGTYTMEVSAIGFAAITKTVVAGNDAVTADVVLEQAPYRLGNIVVTAQKQEEPLQNLPVSITALSSRKVEEYRLWNSKDLTAIVPNLFSADPGDRRNVTGIRGIATTSYDPAVATYIDGVNQFTLDTYISPLFDIERIEVLRGPQGTLYGRNAMGGVINIITRQPSNKTTGFAEANIGNYGTRRYSAGIRVPLITDKLWAGASGLYEGTDGFYTNAFNNSNYDKQRSMVGNYYLKFQAAKNLSFTLNAKHANNRNNGPFPLVIGKEEAFSNPYVLNQNAITQMRDNVLNTSFVANYTGRHVNLSWQTAYQSNYRIYQNPIDADFAPIDGITLINNYGRDWNNVKVLTQEIRATSPAGSTAPLKWTVGTYLFRQNNPTRQTLHFGEDAQYVGADQTNFSLISSTKAKASGAALFGQVTYTLLDKLDVTGGLRYDYEKRKQQVVGEYQPDSEPAPIFAFRPDTSAATNFSAFAPKLGLSYRATENRLLFASYSRGYRAGGLTPLSSDPSQPALYAYKPEYSNNIEAGIKNTFNNRLLVNVTLFYTTITDVQVPALVLPDAVTITRNRGRLTSKGAEAEISATPLKGLELEYSAGITDAQYTDLKVPHLEDSTETDLKGRRQLFTPDLTSMLAVQYSLNLAEQVRLVARGEWRYLGTQYFDLANTIRQSPYQLLNTRVGIATKYVDVFFWGRNLTGKKYIGYAYDFGGIRLGDPRTHGVTLRAKF